MTEEVDQREGQILQVIRCWSSLPELAEFAVRRHGYGNSDVGFGVSYPGDLGENGGDPQGHATPSGLVEVHGYWGEAFEFEIEEREYLAILAKTLRTKGLATDAAKVERLVT